MKNHESQYKMVLTNYFCIFCGKKGVQRPELGYCYDCGSQEVQCVNCSKTFELVTDEKDDIMCQHGEPKMPKPKYDSLAQCPKCQSTDAVALVTLEGGVCWCANGCVTVFDHINHQEIYNFNDPQRYHR